MDSKFFGDFFWHQSIFIISKGSFHSLCSLWKKLKSFLSLFCSQKPWLLRLGFPSKSIFILGKLFSQTKSANLQRSKTLKCFIGVFAFEIVANVDITGAMLHQKTFVKLVAACVRVKFRDFEYRLVLGCTIFGQFKIEPVVQKLICIRTVSLAFDSQFRALFSIKGR